MLASATPVVRPPVLSNATGTVETPLKELLEVELMLMLE
jgi:hypothetical protein